MTLESIAVLELFIIILLFIGVLIDKELFFETAYWLLSFLKFVLAIVLFPAYILLTIYKWYKERQHKSARNLSRFKRKY